MSGVIRPIDHRKKNCTVLSAQCVIWDGPDIPCIDLCHGDSVEKVIYELATELCRILDLLNISTLDLSCFFQNGCGPTDIHQLLQFILDKLCQLNQGLDDLQNQPEEFNCNLLSTCMVNVGCDGSTNLLPIYSSTGPNALSYYANQICTIISNITNIQNAINNINTQIDTINTQISNINTIISGLGMNYSLSGCLAISSFTSSGPHNNINPLVSTVNAIVAELCCFVTRVFDISSINSVCNYNVQISQQACGFLGIGSATFNNLESAIDNIYTDVLPGLCNELEQIETELNNCCSGCASLDSYQPLFLVSRVIVNGSNALPGANQVTYSYQWLNQSEVPSGFSVSSLNITARIFSGNMAVTSSPVSGIVSTGVEYFTLNCPTNDHQFTVSSVHGNINKYTMTSKAYLIFEQTITSTTANCTKRFVIELDCPNCSCGYVEYVFGSEKPLQITLIRDNRY